MVGRWMAMLSLAALLVAAHPVIARIIEFDVSTTALPGTSEGYLFTDSQLSDALEGPREKVCSFCVKVTGQLASVLADPDTAEETIAIMQGAVCPQLPGELQKQCVDALEEYVPQIFITLQELLSTDTLCIESKICSVDAKSSGSMDLASLKLQTPQSCQLCLAIASQMLMLLENGKTEEQIITALHAACSKLKTPGVSEKCEVAVDAYVPQVIDLLQTLSPKDVCSAVKSCPLSPLQTLTQWAMGAKEILAGPRTVSAKLALTQQYIRNGFQTPQECAACRFMVSQAKKKLKDPANQVKLTMLLSEACNKVPDYSDQCKAAVLEYLPMFFANIDVMVDPIRLCTQAKLCEMPAFDSVSQLIALPSTREMKALEYMM